MAVGIEALNVFGGTAYVDVHELARHRGLSSARFANLLLKQKAVALPCEDPVTFGVNAAKPLVDAMSSAAKARIELLITCTESGIDFGKSMSTYIHNYLGLHRNCRLFEVKQACYSGTVGLQMAVNLVLSNTSPGAKALVVATDISRIVGRAQGSSVADNSSFAEPSGGAGAVAMLVSDIPQVFEVDAGAHGYYGYEVMDTCRPIADGEVGDADLSLLSYLDCCENAFLEYQRRVPGAHYGDSFHYLSFHTPFGGMVKGAHRTMMRKMVGMNAAEIDKDFQRRVVPGLTYCQRIGNIMGGTVFLSLASTIDNAEISSPQRVGCFSYGSGCCSEFYSGIVTPDGQAHQRTLSIHRELDERYALSMSEYDSILDRYGAVRFGVRNVKLETDFREAPFRFSRGKSRLFLTGIGDFHREYEWLS